MSGDADLAALVAQRGAPLLQGLEAHVPGAREHADAVATYALGAAVELGFERARAELVRELARLHDVGQVYVPAHLLARPAAKLAPDELERLGSHSLAGRDLARGAGIPEAVCEWILLARERFDGRGTGGVAGEQIPIESRIVHAACVCDSALAAPATDPSAASAGERRHRAIDELRAAAGRELDPDVVGALVAVLERAGWERPTAP